MKVEKGRRATNRDNVWTCPGAQLNCARPPRGRTLDDHQSAYTDRPRTRRARKGGASAHCGGGGGVAPMTDEKMPPDAGGCEGREGRWGRCAGTHHTLAREGVLAHTTP